jgi:hypothetical protein
MSNSYTTFYFELPLKDKEQAEKVAALLDTGDDYCNMDPDRQEKVLPQMEEIFSEFGEYEELGFEWSTHEGKVTHAPDETKMAWTLCVHSDEWGNVEHATELIQWLLPELEIKAAGFEYAMFGGGENSGGAVACIMTDKGVDVQWTNTSTWLAEKLG